jgi:hypothetical protein|tara:strand:- start:9122 stop:9937 length:816 start_codon:yes stop_codon:yes gene_type:complete
MATYKSDAGAILTPGNQINKLSAFNHEGVLGWPGIELFEQIGFVKVSNLEADKASFKSFSITVPSPDRRVSDRVRDDRTSLVVKASAGRPAYVYGASIAIAQDTPSGGLPSFPASPITADLGGTTTELLLLGPDNSGSPLGVPSTQLNGLAAASSSITAASSLFAQGSEDTTTGDFPAWTSVTSTIAAGDAANSMMYKVTADTTFKVYNVNAITGTSVNGDGVFISADDSTAGRAAYIVCRVNYLRPAKAVTWDDVSSFVDFASQVGGTDS